MARTGFWESRVLTQIENLWGNIPIFMTSVHLCLSLTIEEAPGPFFVHFLRPVHEVSMLECFSYSCDLLECLCRGPGLCGCEEPPIHFWRMQRWKAIPGVASYRTSRTAGTRRSHPGRPWRAAKRGVWLGPKGARPRGIPELSSGLMGIYPVSLLGEMSRSSFQWQFNC